MKKLPPYSIIHQDDAIVAINKPAGLSVLPGRGRTESLIKQLEVDPRLEGRKPLLLHRIDADTSGLLLFALSPEAQKNISAQFHQRTVSKEYWAIVRGMPLHESGSVDMPIGIDPNDSKRMIIRGLEPKKSRTKWILGQRFDGVTLLKVFPITGRRHQIRVHLKAMGYPLVVDPLYGGTELKLSEFKRRFKLGKTQEERPLLARLSLHARSITFLHPLTNQEIKLEAELPKDFRATLEALQKWASRGV